MNGGGAKSIFPTDICKWYSVSCKCNCLGLIKATLEEFSKFTGPEVNQEKSAAYFSKVYWIIDGKYNYWLQGKAIPKSVVKKNHRLTYQFIWDGGKVNPMETDEKMTLPKAEDEIGVRNFEILISIIPVRRAAEFQIRGQKTKLSDFVFSSAITSLFQTSLSWFYFLGFFGKYP